MLTLVFHIVEVSGSDLQSETYYLYQRYSCIHSVSPDNPGTVPHLRTQRAPHTQDSTIHTSETTFILRYI